MRVLLIADDASSESIGTALHDEGFVIEYADCSDDAIELAKLYDFDAIVVDLELNRSTGRDVVRQLRKARIDLPVLAISRKVDVEAVVDVLGAGADDCIAKPVYRLELAARVRAIIRRARGYSEPTIRVGKLAIDLGARVVRVGNRSLHLTNKEYGVLELLSLRKGRALEKEIFLDHLYEGRDEPEVKIVDVFICKLRKKLAEATGGEHYIETVWGHGYMMRDPQSAPLH